MSRGSLLLLKDLSSVSSIHSLLAQCNKHIGKAPLFIQVSLMLIFLQDLKLKNILRDKKMTRTFFFIDLRNKSTLTLSVVTILVEIII